MVNSVLFASKRSHSASVRDAGLNLSFRSQSSCENRRIASLWASSPRRSAYKKRRSMSEKGNSQPRPNPPVATSVKSRGPASPADTRSSHSRLRMSSMSRVRCATAARPSLAAAKSRAIRADSSARVPRSSLISEDAAIMTIDHESKLAALAPHVVSERAGDTLLMKCRRVRAKSLTLQRSFAPLLIANADYFIHPRQKNLSIANLARSRRHQDGLHCLLHHPVRQHDLQLCLRNQIHTVFAAAVNFGVALLPAMASHLNHRHTLDADLLQRGLHRFQFGILDDCFDLGHDVVLRLRSSRLAPAGAAGLGISHFP